ncbi:hypothetical protein G6M12_19475 [Agrobacterium tumefaciens]|nr:hypothetical protein [Agrobacterium tumefaciens]
MDINFTNYPHNLSSNEIILIISREFPNLVHGVDYWTMHQVESNSSTRISPAIIYQWKPAIPMPTPAELAGFALLYAADIEAMLINEERASLYPPMTQLEFRNLLTANAIYPRAVSNLIDDIQDEAFKARLSAYWEYTDWFRRDDEFTVWLADAVGRTPAEFDEIWRY